MKRGRRPKAALNDHALSVTRLVMTWSAEDIVAFSPAFEYLSGDRKWKSIDQLSVNRARVQMIVDSQVPTRDGPGDEGARGPTILKERADLERL